MSPHSAVFFLAAFLPGMAFGAEPVYRDGVLADIPLVYYEMDETSGNSAADWSADINDFIPSEGDDTTSWGPFPHPNGSGDVFFRVVEN